MPKIWLERPRGRHQPDVGTGDLFLDAPIFYAGVHQNAGLHQLAGKQAAGMTSYAGEISRWFSRCL
jgi:hypothetical protein